MPGKALQTQVLAASTQSAFPVWLWLNPALLPQSSPENGEEREDVFVVRRLVGRTRGPKAFGQACNAGRQREGAESGSRLRKRKSEWACAEQLLGPETCHQSRQRHPQSCCGMTAKCKGV